MGLRRVLHRLGHARHQREHSILRPDQLPPGLRMAAIHRVGITCRIPGRQTRFGLLASDAEPEYDLESRPRIGDGAPFGRILRAAWAQHRAPDVVFRDGAHPDAARIVWTSL